MVNLSTIRQSNKSILPSLPTGFVAVFVGATRGIGAGTLKAFVKNTGSGTFYVVGRSKAIFATQLAELESPNANVTIHFIQAEISLLRDVDAVCKTISARESKVDLLFMSAGLLRFFGPHYTAEGLDTCLAVNYYSRMKLTSNLLPLLERSRAPRILSVLAAGEEAHVRTTDLGLTRHYTVLGVVKHTTTMQTLAWEHLASLHPSVSFIHAHPGKVSTDITQGLFACDPRAWYRPLFSVFKALATWFMWLVGITADEAGERQTFIATSPRYPSSRMIEDSAARPEGGDMNAFARCSHGTNGVYRLDWRGESVVDDRVLGPYRQQGLPRDIWEHTLETFKKHE